MVPVYSCAVVQTLSILQEHELFCLRKQCRSTSDKLQTAVCNFTGTCFSLDFLCTQYSPDYCGSNTKCNRTMPQWCSVRLKFSLKFELRIFPKAKPFCHPMDRVYSCFDLTDSKVISATLSVRKSESSQDFRRFVAYFWSVFLLFGCPPARKSISPIGRIFMKF